MEKAKFQKSSKYIVLEQRMVQMFYVKYLEIINYMLHILLCSNVIIFFSSIKDLLENMGDNFTKDEVNKNVAFSKYTSI